jgi:SPP1 family predicted phage head-tail adaptor
MDAGDLDRRITLKRAIPFEGAIEDDVVWVPLAEVWASHSPLLDAERVKAEAVGATMTDRFKIRWSPELADLSAADLLTFEGRDYQIAAVKEVGGRRNGLEITATAQADQLTPEQIATIEGGI